MDKKLDLLLKKKKIEAALVIGDAEKHIEKAMKSIKQISRVSQLMYLFAFAFSAAGYIAIIFVLPPHINWLLRFFIYTSYTFGTWQFLTAFFRERKDIKRIEREHKVWQEFHQKMKKETGLEKLIDDPKKEEPIEKLVN